MPNIKSQKKRVITNAKKQAENKTVKSNLKTELKKADSDLVAKPQSEARAEIVSNAFSTVDKAAKKGSIHKNNANRKKAALARKASKD